MATKMRWGLSFLQRKLYPDHSFGPILNLHLRRICVASTVEDEGDKLFDETALTVKEEEEKKRREAGKQLHAAYHIKVNEIAEKFLVKQLEEEKHLNDEKRKKEELRLLEKEMHDRVIESVKLENERIQRLREERNENQKLLNEECNREREKAKKEIEERQRQERIELVRNAIEESKSWVTHENLEEKIAYCLEHETTYNFLLLPTGEKHYSTSPPGSIDTEENTPGPAAYYLTGSPSRSTNQEHD